MGRRAIWVVKIGGSLWGSHLLRNWLGLLADLPDRRVVIVPGGGPFSDVVRETQDRIGFSDRAAHRMAILGMEQYGLALLDLEPRLRPAVRRTDLQAMAGPLLWLPAAMTGTADLPESWDVTSDSLAAWLAREIGADRLVLVKSAELPAGSVAAAELAAAGILDPVFPSLLARLACPVWCVERGAHAEFAAACGRREAFGTFVIGERQSARAPMT